MRGALCFVVAVISLLLFDHDEMLDHMGHAGDHEHILFRTSRVKSAKTNMKIRKPEKIAVIALKCEQCGFTFSIDVYKNADRIGNSVDPDQTAPSQQPQTCLQLRVWCNFYAFGLKIRSTL